jgi:diguanylate cyclase
MTTTATTPGAVLCQPFSSFQAAATAALVTLQRQLDFDLVMVTRKKAAHWVILNAQDRRYGIAPGGLYPWDDSLCAAMAQGQAPQIAPDISVIAPYAQSGLAQKFNIGAYFGLPLHHSDGSLFGTLCGFHPEAKTAALFQHQPQLRLLAQLLVSQLDSELKLIQIRRQVERAEATSWRDNLTGLYNRQAWTHFLTMEDSRCQRYSHEACIITLELDLQAINQTSGRASGDRWLRRVADLLRELLREQDIIARVSGNEIAILAVETEAERLGRLVERIRTQLNPEAFEITLGCAVRDPAQGLLQAWRTAETAMHLGRSPSGRTSAMIA